MNSTTALRVTALVGFLGVALGAFGAHGLGDHLRALGTLPIWEKAVLYQLVHVVVMLALALRSPLARGPWGLFLAGVTIFSGSLYVLAFTGMKWLGAITPIGGLCLLGGWLWLAVRPPAISSR